MLVFEPSGIEEMGKDGLYLCADCCRAKALIENRFAAVGRSTPVGPGAACYRRGRDQISMGKYLSALAASCAALSGSSSRATRAAQ